MVSLMGSDGLTHLSVASCWDGCAGFWTSLYVWSLGCNAVMVCLYSVWLFIFQMTRKGSCRVPKNKAEGYKVS